MNNRGIQKRPEPTQPQPQGGGQVQGQGHQEAERREMVQPPVDIYENDEEFLLIADVPGVSESNLKIRLDRNELTFEAQRNWHEEGRVLSHDQRGGYGYARRFSIPGGIDGTKISARMKEGVLFIHLPKSEQLKPREIPVRTS